MWERALYLLVLLGTGCRTPPPLPPKPNQPVVEGEGLPEAKPEPESEDADAPGNSPASPGEPDDAATPLKHPR